MGCGTSQRETAQFVSARPRAVRSYGHAPCESASRHVDIVSGRNILPHATPCFVTSCRDPLCGAAETPISPRRMPLRWHVACTSFVVPSRTSGPKTTSNDDFN